MTDLDPQERRILVALRASPVPLSMRDLCEILYWDRPDGGAETADTVVGRRLYTLRRKCGIEIPCIKQFGFRLSERDREILNARAESRKWRQAA